MRTYFLFLAAIFLFACSNERGVKKSLIPEDELIPILIDFHMVYAVQGSPDYYKLTREVDSVDAYTYIFEKHGYSRAQFDSTISWYASRPDQYVEIYDEVIMRLTRISDSLEQESE